MNNLKRWWWVLLLVPLAAAGGFAAWAELGPTPMPEARQALAAPPEADGVAVDRQGSWIAFRPTQGEVSTGLVLYPGGRIEPAAYAPLARTIADDGYLVVLVSMPLDLAFLAPRRAAAVQDSFPAIENWAVGGHSLGGAMAARYAVEHEGAVDGLLLWAAYPAESDDLSRRELEVVSIYGTRDGLATTEKIEASRPLLPPDTVWIAVDGGNHAQFGWYGAQRGDQEATISRREQQEQVISGSVRLLEDVEG